MKKILLTCVAAVGLAASANAQLASGSVFPDFTLTDINGGVHHLYADLAAGKTVFIDISATWCPPCWAYHNTHAMDSLYAKHGPLGAPGVYANTTNDVEVLFYQGEGTSKYAELVADVSNGAILFTTTELPYANVTQGDWTAGTLYPIIDDTTGTNISQMDQLWSIAYFPTMYMICRDHLVHELTQPTEPDAYAASLAGCPQYAPSATIDAKAASYGGSNYFTCNAAPSVTFQNYSTTNNITAATITVKDASGATVATAPWTGNLAPYAVATAAVPSFAGTTFGGYKYSVDVTGDSYPANNGSVDSVFKIYAASNAGTVPYTDNFSTSPDLTYKYSFPTDGSIGIVNPAFAGCPGPDGTVSNKFLLVDFYDFTAGTGSFDYVVGNFNTTGTQYMHFDFDQAYALYTGQPSDILKVEVSTDCGANWTTAWTGQDGTLTTGTALQGQFVPTAASDWQHRSVDVSTYDNDNMMLKFKGTSSYGNFAWLANFKLAATSAVAQVNNINSDITLAPNPAKDMANVTFTLAQAASVQVQVLDAVGRVVNTVNENMNAGAQKITLSTSTMPAGLYNVRIQTGNTVETKQLSVIK